MSLGGNPAVKMAETQAEILSINKLNFVVKGAPVPGKMKVTQAGMAFKEDGENKPPVTINKPELDSARWLRVGRGNQLRIKTKAGNSLTFDDITNANKLDITEFFEKEFAITIESVDVNVAGWNWGRLELEGQTLTFAVDGQPSFELPMNAVSNASSSSKHEAAVEFHVDADDRNGQKLESMRFHFTAHSDDEDEAGGKRQAEVWVDKIMSKADILKSTGLSIAKLPEIMCMAPRAKYDFEFHHEFFHMRSKAADYKLKYTSVQQMFKLTQPDRNTEFFVVTLDPPLKHNLKRHDIVTFQLSQSTEVEVEVNMTDDAEIQEKLKKAQVLETETGPVCDVLARLLKAMSLKKLYGPSKSYRSKHGNEGLKCNIKTTIDGFLYPLEKAFLFVYKNPVYVRFDQIRVVELQGLTKATHSSVRAFTLNVQKKDGDTVGFSGIQKEEYQALKNYLEAKNIDLTTDETTGDGGLSLYNENSDDEDMYGAMAKAEGRKSAGGDDEGSSADESFKGSDMEESDVDEEFDSDGGSSNEDMEEGDGDGDGAARPKKAKKEKGEKKEKALKPPKMVKQRTMSAYMLYSQEARPKITTENPEIKNSEVMKKIGEHWNGLSPEEKKPFEDKAAELKAAAPMIEKVVKKAADEDPNAPKRPKNPKSAYLFFSNDADAKEAVKAANPEAEHKDMMSLMGAKWSAMSDEEKRPFVDSAAPDKARYMEEMAAYKEAVSGAKRKKKVKKHSDKPKNALGAYMLFANAKRAEVQEQNPEASFGQNAKTTGKLWAALSEEEKLPYKDEELKRKEQYKIDLEAWRQKKIAAGEDPDEGKEPSQPRAKKAKVAKNQSMLNFKSAAMVESDDDVDSE